MPKRLVILAASLGAILLIAMPAAASAAEPWWQILSGSRPTHLWEPKDAAEVQEVKTELIEGIIFVGKVEVQGSVIGCLNKGDLTEFGITGNELCEMTTGFPASESAAELETMLEGPYGAGEVEVTGGPAGTPFQVHTDWGVAPVKVEPSLLFEAIPLGTASSEIVSEGSGRLFVNLTNLGDAPLDATSTPLTITDELPEGVIAYDVEAFAGAQAAAGPVECDVKSASTVSCTFEDELTSYEAIEVEIPVVLQGSPPAAGAPGRITVSGGNAAAASAAQPIEVSEEPVPFGLERFEMRAEEEGGAVTTQAGAHPFQVTNTIQLNSGRMVGKHADVAPAPSIAQPALPRNVRVTFPTGLVGTSTPVAQCEIETFFATANLINKCPAESAVGVASVTLIESQVLYFTTLAVPVFNLVPQHGEPARLGFMVGANPVVITTSADSDNGYRITGEVRNVTQLAKFYASTITLWGTPGDPRHDSARGWNCVYFADDVTGECTPPANRDETPFLRMPTSCKAPLEYRTELEPWNVPIGSVIDSASVEGDPLLGCNKVPFDPAISSAATSKLAESPTGLDFELRLPGSGFDNPSPGAVSEAQPKRIEVALPEGMTLNPAQAEGLAVCTPADYAREKADSKPGEGCPEASKIGNVEAATPLIDEKLEGSLYVAAPYDNPSNSLIATYIVARSPERGILVKQPLEVRPDPGTGRLVAIADHAPPVPYDYFRLRFREGGRAPLITPPACGSFQTTARFVPYSAQDPDNPAPSEVVTRTANLDVRRGVDGGACPSGGVPPFGPGFEAGSLSNNAGSFSPFYMRISRKDGDQGLTKFSAALPKGALAKLAGVARCPQAAVEAAKGKTGLDEKANPSCPASSRIGRTNVGAGVGSVLTYVPGSLYLGGPYHGAPLSVVSITPAVAGPFDVGTVVVQEALDLDPRTGVARVDGSASDPIPNILAGIPLKVRDLRVYVDRDQFTTTPTSCDPLATGAQLFGAGLDLFSSDDDVPVSLSARYQVANCANLGFKPRLRIHLKGKRSRRGAHPALRAVLRPKAGNANIRQISVLLPPSELLENAHIRTICTNVQFAANGGTGGGCPKGSIYGHVRAWTPLLDEPLEGPVYLRSSNHRLPDLVLALRGLVDVEAAGRIDSVSGRLRTTFEDLPDAPLTRVVLEMQGGKKGLLVNSTDICREVHRFRGQLIGQSGKLFTEQPKVTAKCKGGRR